MKYGFLLIAYLLCITLLTSQTDVKDLEAAIDKIVAPWPDNGPGGVIGIVEKGQLVFSKAYGKASLEYDIPNTKNTQFNLASVSKQFTAYSLVLLEQQGKLSIDDDIRKYLPEIPNFGKTITIRNLLTHTSGLRNFQNLLAIAGWREGESMTNEDLLRYMSMQRELNYPVGNEYLYCNSGFVLATFIVERVTGQDFKDWTKENIFKPLGMDNTEYREDMEMIMKNTATSYSAQNQGFRQPLKYWTYMGNGNVYSTVDDLAKWIRHFRNPTLGNGKTSIDRLTERGILNNGDTLTYALGIGVSNLRGEKRYSHGGSVGGYRSQLMYFPKLETGFIVITNFSSANAGGITNELVDLYLGHKLKPKNNQPSDRYPHVNKEIAISSEAYNACVGEYMVDGVLVKVFEEEGKMFFEAKGILPVTEVKAASDTSFFIPGLTVSVYIHPRKDGNRLVARQGDNTARGRQIDQSLTEADQLEQYEGTFYSPELETEYTISVQKDKLIGYHARHGEFKIIPMQRNELSADVFFFADIKIERWSNGEVKGLRVSNGRVRNVWFGKK